MFVRFRTLSVLLLFCVLWSAPASADDTCPALSLLTSVDLSHRPGDTHVYVPVTINGEKRFMLLDTGGTFSEVTSQAVADLGLSSSRIRFSEVNLSGEESHQAATVNAFSIGRLTTKSIELVVAPEKYLFLGDPLYVGIIAPDILRNYDVDIDFGASKLALISPEHCEGKVIYWQASAVAVMPMRVLPSGHIVIPVTLDGKDINAVLDTGAYETSLMQPIAEDRFGLKMGSPDTPAKSHMTDRPNSQTFQHTFASLNFGGVAVSNLRVSILPDFLKQKFGEPELGSRLDESGREGVPDMLIGMNVLRHLHIYIAYREQKLYITPAGAPTATAPGQAVAPAPPAGAPPPVPH